MGKNTEDQQTSKQKKEQLIYGIIFFIILFYLVGPVGLVRDGFCSVFTCAQSSDSIEKAVIPELQKILDSNPAYLKYKMQVKKVSVIHSQGNNYSGIAFVYLNDVTYQIPVTIVADYKSAMFNIDPRGFGFLYQLEIENAKQEAEKLRRETIESYRNTVNEMRAIGSNNKNLEVSKD